MSARDKTRRRLYRRLIVLRSCLLLFNILYSCLSYFVLFWFVDVFFLLSAAVFSMNAHKDIYSWYCIWQFPHVGFRQHRFATQTQWSCLCCWLWLLLWKSWKKRRIFRRKNTISAEMTKTAVPQVAVWAAVRDSFRLQSHRPRSVNPAVTTTHQGKGCNPKHDWHNYYFEGEDSQFPVCVTFPLPLSKLLASVCKQVSDCRKLLVTKGVCITLCDCGEGVVPGSAAAEGWCTELQGQCQGGWRERCVCVLEINCHLVLGAKPKELVCVGLW